MTTAKKKYYHVDDSSVASRVFCAMLKSVDPEVETKSFKTGQDLFTFLKQDPANLPDILFSDYNMPGMTGIDILATLKRDPKLHYIPVVIVTAELEEGIRNEAGSYGAVGYITKPVDEEKVRELLQKNRLKAMTSEMAFELDQAFSDEAMDRVGEMFLISNQISKDTVSDLYRGFHTIKGTAGSLQYPHLAQFVHNAEEFLNAVKEGNLYGVAQVRELLTYVIQHIESQVEHIKTQTLLDLPPESIKLAMKQIKVNVASGWRMAPSVDVMPTDGVLSANVQTQVQAAQHTQGTEDSTNLTKSPIVSKSGSSVRIRNESMDELQKKFKKIIQTRVKLNGFANLLKQEFSDEKFPQDLIVLVSDLGTQASEIMEFFISLRVVPATRLKTFCQQVVSQTSEKLQKPAGVEVNVDSTLEIDQVVLEALESGLTHILRNSVDHGLESFEERVAAGKQGAGTIKVDVRKDGTDSFVIEVCDDGAGINQEKLRNAVLSKGLFPPEAIQKLKKEEVEDMIFMDGLSTKENVSDVSGRGVGLSAVREQIQSLGGTIRVSSESGKGTTFLISAPRFFKL